MSEGEGLGETWCLATAIDYVHRIEGYELEQEFYRAAFDDETLQIAARPPVEEVRRYPSQRSIDGLLLALRDGQAIGANIDMNAAADLWFVRGDR